MDDSRVYGEVAIAGSEEFSGHLAVTAAVTTAGDLFDDVWSVDQQTGAISRLGELKATFQHSHVAISPFFVKRTPDERTPPPYFVVADTYGGMLQMRFIRIDATGKPLDAGDVLNAFVPADQVRLAPLGTGGFMVATRSPQDNVQLDAWDASRGADATIEANSIAEHDASDAVSFDLLPCPVDTCRGRLRDRNEGPRRATPAPDIPVGRSSVLTLKAGRLRERPPPAGPGRLRPVRPQTRRLAELVTGTSNNSTDMRVRALPGIAFSASSPRRIASSLWATVARLKTAKRPSPPAGTGKRIDVYLGARVALLVNGDRVERVIKVSTGFRPRRSDQPCRRRSAVCGSRA